MKILILEDRGSVSFYLEKIFTEKGYSVFLAYTIYEAMYYFENNDINCIICDLNLSPEGLTPNEITKTKDGLFSGWVWIQNYVINDRPNFRKKIVIYSDYINVLENDIPKNELVGIKLLQKRGYNNSASELLAFVESLKTL